MRSESFYSTIAQVLPTLLIAMALEFASMRRAGQEVHGYNDPNVMRHGYASGNIINVGAIVTALAGLMVILGEALAVLVLLTGTDGWLPLVAGPFCGLSVVLLTLLVTWVHWVHQVQDNV
jgi:hypothetical protein